MQILACHSLLSYSLALSVLYCPTKAQSEEDYEDSYPQVVLRDPTDIMRDSSFTEQDLEDDTVFRSGYPPEQNEPHKVSATTDIFCWMGNSRISDTCTLERCDYWVTYNATKSPKGFACIRVGYTVDRSPHVYRNCVNTVSSVYDPCEAAIQDADSYRVNVTSCDLCWDNGCNVRGYRNLWYNNSVMEGRYRSGYSNFHITSWAWFIVLLCCACALLTCVYLACARMFKPMSAWGAGEPDDGCDCEEEPEVEAGRGDAGC